MNTNLKDEQRTSPKDASNVCGLSDLKTSLQEIMKSCLRDNQETGLEDALTFYAGDIFKTFPMMCLDDQHGDVLKIDS